MEDQPDRTYRLGECCLERPEWLHRVLTRFRRLQDLEHVPGPGTGLRQLVLLERAVQVTTQKVQKDFAQTMKQHEPDDGAKDLALIMAFLRAIRRQRWWRARQLAFKLPCLQSFREIEGRGGSCEEDLRLLHRLALDIGKRLFAQQLRAEQAEDAAQ